IVRDMPGRLLKEPGRAYRFRIWGPVNGTLDRSVGGRPMPRMGRALRYLNVTAGDQSRAAAASGLRLSWWGRLIAAVFVGPGVAAAMFSLYLPNSDQGGVFSVSAVTFYLGGLVILTGPAWAVMYAFGMPSLRRVPDDPAWQERRRDGGHAYTLTVGLSLA